MNPTTLRTLRRAVLGTLPLWMCATALADVTLRYQLDIKLGAATSPQVKEQMEKSESTWANSIVRMKNGKCWSQTGIWTSIIDFATEKMTLIDSGHQTFATLPVADLPDKMAALMPKPPEIPDAAKKAMSAMKTTVESKVTGRTETILGVQAEEREFVLNIEMPMPAGVNRPPATMKMAMRIWTSKPDEALHNQAIRELTGFKLWSNYFMNPGWMMEKMFASMPGHGDFVEKITTVLSANNGVMLRTSMAMYMAIPGANPDSPMFEMTNEAVELSSASVDGAVFGIPIDYKSIPADELLTAVFAKQIAATGVPKQ
jgi:hypothetical protein